MIIRKYQISDCTKLAELFYNTIHTINAKDYTKEQLNAWAAGCADLEKWNQSFLKNCSVVSVKNNVITGFGDINKACHLNRLYVHKDYQGKGIGSAICDKLEQAASSKITVFASITAKSFFEKRKYKVVKMQKVERFGILLTNFVMEKIL